MRQQEAIDESEDGINEVCGISGMGIKEFEGAMKDADDVTDEQCAMIDRLRSPKLFKTCLVEINERLDGEGDKRKIDNRVRAVV